MHDHAPRRRHARRRPCPETLPDHANCHNYGQAYCPAVLLLVAALTVLAPGAEPTDKGFQPGRDGWLSLFDGSDLDRWTPAKGSDWALKEGLLGGTKGEIFNYWHWADFELIAVCRGSGAICFRVAATPLSVQAGYRLSVVDGTLIGSQGHIITQGSGSPTKDWREIRLLVTKDRFTVQFDGKRVAEGNDTACRGMGKIGLMADGKTFQVRLIRIRPLNREKHAAVPSSNSSCYVCHVNFEEEVISKTHASKEIECSKCHGPSFDHRSDEANVTAPDVMFIRGEVDAACLHCHERHEPKKPKEKRTIPKKPVCTDCHGNHRSSN